MEFPRITKTYYKFGAGPASLSLSDITFAATSDDYRNFEFTVTGTPQVRSSLWEDYRTSYSVNWRVDAATGSVQKFTFIPAELLEKYPVLNTIKLFHRSTKFIKHLDGFTYDDYIKYTMSVSNPAKPYPTEYQTIEFF